MISHEIDYAAMVGGYPFRRLPEPTPERLLAEMDRHGIKQAWVGHVPSVFYRDVAAGNDELFDLLEPHRVAGRLLPVPAVNPAWPAWEHEIARAVEHKCPAVRAWPAHLGFATSGVAMQQLAQACGRRGLALVLTIRFEDPRQRSRLDVAGDLIGQDIRNAVRADEKVQLLVVGADRAIVEEVHWGSTPEEARRIRWDISAIWGPPDDHLAHLMRTVGEDRFVFGSQFPFRLHESAIVKAELQG